MTERLDGFAQLRAWHSAELDAVAHRQGAAAAVVRDMRRCAMKFRKVTPSVDGMALRTGYSSRQIKRATAWLEQRGRLTVIRRRAHCRGDGTWHRSQTNWYAVRWPGRELPPAPKRTRRPCSHRGDMGGPSMSLTVRTPPGVSVPAVGGNDPPPPPPHPAEPPPPPAERVAPPWVREGIDRDEWLRRQIGSP